MFSRRLWIAGALACGLLATGPATAEERYGRWEMLGSREVALSRDRDTIRVGRYEGDFRRIRLVVRRNAVYISHMAVIYSNGGYDNIPISALIGRDGSSRIIDLRGGQRHISRVDLTYRSVRGDRRKARVEVWARH